MCPQKVPQGSQITPHTTDRTPDLLHPHNTTASHLTLQPSHLILEQHQTWTPGASHLKHRNETNQPFNHGALQNCDLHAGVFCFLYGCTIDR